VILHQDEKPKFFYIIIEGECKTVFETVELKDKKEYNKRLANKKEQLVNTNAKLNCGPIDYKKYSKPPSFEKKYKVWKIADAAFLGKYEDTKMELKDNNVIDLEKELITDRHMKVLKKTATYTELSPMLIN